jgi:hypothetical protein
MASALTLFSFISSPLLAPVSFHSDCVSSTGKALFPKLFPRARRSTNAKGHQLAFIQVKDEFNLANFLQGDWILHKNISYSKLYQDMLGSEGDARFEGQASFVSVKPPRTASEPHHLWYKEHGSVTMAGRSTVRFFLLPQKFLEFCPSYPHQAPVSLLGAGRVSRAVLRRARSPLRHLLCRRPGLGRCAQVCVAAAAALPTVARRRSSPPSFLPPHPTSRLQSPRRRAATARAGGRALGAGELRLFVAFDLDPAAAAAAGFSVRPPPASHPSLQIYDHFVHIPEIYLYISGI